MRSEIWRRLARWLVALAVCCLGLGFVFVWMVTLPVVEHGPARLLDAIRFEPIRAALDLITLAVFSLVLAIWTFSTSFAIGFALRNQGLTRLRWGTGAWLLFLGLFVWWLHPLGPVTLSRISVLVAAVVFAAGTACSLRGRHRGGLVLATAAVTFLALTIPFWVAFAKASPTPPEAHKLWSVRLENEDFHDENTASVYGGQRQVIVVGGRVLVAYAAGRAPSTGSQLMSTFRLMSLDLQTGDTKSSRDFVGRWGLDMPHLYVDDDGHAVLVHRVLTPLTPSGAVDWAERPGNTPIDVNSLLPTSENFEWSETTVPSRESRVFNDKVFWNGQYGRFAGASDNGKRYAFEFSDGRGDFPEVLYEHFVIYNAITKQPIAMVRMKSLAKNQSWTALSLNGEYFVAGNPNDLSLYALPQ